MLQICQKYALICVNLQRNSSFYEEIGVFYDDFAFCVRYFAFFGYFHSQRVNGIKMNCGDDDNFKSYSKTAFYANGIMANPRKDFHMAALTHWAFQTILYAFVKH